MKLPNKGGKGSKTSTTQKKKGPKCSQNRDFEDRMEIFREKKIWPERGIRLDELSNTPMAVTINNRGLGGLAATPPIYSEPLVREFYAGMNPGEFMRGGPVLVIGVPVHMNAMDINIYFRTILLGFEEMRERMIEGITTSPLYVRGLVDFANNLTITPMLLWIARGHPLKQSNLKIEPAFWHIFITSSLRSVSHRSTVPFKAARILHCIMEG